MTSDLYEQVGGSDIQLVPSEHGVGKSWFMQDSSASGAAYGLAGAIATAIVDAIANAAPAARARQIANELDEVVNDEYVNQSLQRHLTQELEASTASNKILVKPHNKKDDKDRFVVRTGYTLSEGSRALKVSTNVEYNSSEIPYTTLYSFEKSVPSAEKKGPIYRNTFVYHSDHIPLPEYSDELEQRLVEQIETRYRSENGQLPTKGDKEFRKFNGEIKNARDGELSKSEASVFLTRNWTAENGKLLKQELEKAHQFIAKQLFADLTRYDVPVFEGQDLPLIEDGEDRVVMIESEGYQAGQIVSRSLNEDETVTYGNVVRFPKE